MMRIMKSMNRFQRGAVLKPDAGFSILEALVASVVLVVALVGFLTVAAATTNLGGRSARSATANALIYDKYEALKLAGFAAITNETVADIDMDSNGSIIPGSFTRTVTVNQLDAGTPLTIAAKVSITVSWLGHSISQTSIFTAES